MPVAISSSDGFLLDTNCISEMVRVRPDTNVVRWFATAAEQSLYLSALTLGEVRKGLIKVPPGPRHAQLEAWLTVGLRQRFVGRILAVNEAVAERWGVLIGEAKRTGKTIPVVDSLLAATALHYNLTVVSRNVADFSWRKSPSSIRGCPNIRSNRRQGIISCPLPRHLTTPIKPTAWRDSTMNSDDQIKRG